MLQLPEKLLKKYQVLLDQNNVPAKTHGVYIKWLRYYLDFCKKYKHSYAGRPSLFLFINKLRDKGQTHQQQIQAGKAVEIYYSGLTTQTSFVKPQENVKEPFQKYQPCKTTSPWNEALKAFGNEIRQWGRPDSLNVQRPIPFSDQGNLDENPGPWREAPDDRVPP